MPVFIKFYRNLGNSGKILHSTQVDRSINKHPKLHPYQTMLLAKVV